MSIKAVYGKQKKTKAVIIHVDSNGNVTDNSNVSGSKCQQEAGTLSR